MWNQSTGTEVDPAAMVLLLKEPYQILLVAEVPLTCPLATFLPHIKSFKNRMMMITIVIKTTLFKIYS